MKVVVLLLFSLILREAVGNEEEEPGDPDLQTIIIHADSSKTLQKNFDDLEDSGWLENWNVPLIIANTENGAKDEEVEKVQKRVKFLPGRFKNKKAVIHMKDESKMDGSADKESVVESWIVGDKGPEHGRDRANGPESGTEKKVAREKGKSGEKRENPEGKEQTTGKFSGPEDMDKDGNMHTIVIHSDTNAARQRYFDELEDSKAFDNWMVPRIITNAHNKTMRKKIKDFKNKTKMSFRGKFANKQAVIHVRDEQDSSPNSPRTSEGHTASQDKHSSGDMLENENVPIEGLANVKSNNTEQETEMGGSGELNETSTEEATTVADDEIEEISDVDATLDLAEAFNVAEFFNNILGTIEYYWILTSSDEVLHNDKIDAGQRIPWYLTSKTFVKTPNETYIFYKAFEDYHSEYKSYKLHGTNSIDKQWDSVQRNAMKLYDLVLYQYGNTLDRKPVLMGFWNETCESLEWATKLKLTSSQNLAHICILHEIRRSRFKYFTPPEAKQQDCTKDPLRCIVTKEDIFNYGLTWHSLMIVDGAEFHDEEWKDFSYNPIFFSSAGGYERLVVGYFVLKPKQQTSKFNIFGGFLFAEALIAILAFGIIITALIFFSSGSNLREVMFYMFAAVFEQGQRVPINAHEHGRRAFFGKVICFLWLLSWLILRQFLSGALVSNLTREDPPNTPTTNHDNLIQFLKEEGAILVEPLKRDENDWFQGSRDKLNSTTGKCWKADFISHIFKNDTEENKEELFPELKLMACIKSESESSDCEDFKNITVPYAFSYISTERRLETMKKLANLVDKGIFVSTSNVETPFVKPNFFAPYGVEILRPLLSKDFANYFESGIFQKWQKLDEELEGLAGCITHVTKENPEKFGNKTEEQIKVTRRHCRELLDQDKKSGKDWIRRQLGKIDPVKLKEIKFPILFLLLGNGLAFIVFLFEKFLPRRVIVWLEEFVEKIENIRNIFMRRRRVDRVYPQEFELSGRVREAVEIRGSSGQVDNRQEEDQDDDQGNDHLSSPTMEENEEKRLEHLLQMIDAHDRLVFTDADFWLLQKSGVIMTDEEAKELAMAMRQDEAEAEMPMERSGEEEDEVQELPRTDPPVPGMVVTEAWIENEQEEGNIKGEEPQVEGERGGDPCPTRPRFWEDDLGEIITLRNPAENDE